PPAAPGSAWPSRCPFPGTPASSRPPRARRRRAAAPPRGRGPTCLTRWRRPAPGGGVPPRQSDGCDGDACLVPRAGGHGHELAPEVVGGGVGDAHVRERARREWTAGQVDELVLAGAPRQHRRVLLARPLDQDLL